MSTNSNQDKSFPKGVERKADAAISGLLSHMPAGVTQLTVGKVTYQLPDLVKHAEQLLKPWKDARAARAIVAQIMQERPVDEPKLRGFLADLKYAIACVVGRESEELRNFGFAPQRRRELTAEEKVAAAEKAKLTRELHHAQGSKPQKPGDSAGAGPSATTRVA